MKHTRAIKLAILGGISVFSFHFVLKAIDGYFDYKDVEMAEPVPLQRQVVRQDEVVRDRENTIWSIEEVLDELEPLSLPEDKYASIAENLFSKLKEGNYPEVEASFDTLLQTKETADDGIYSLYYVYKKLATLHPESSLDIFTAWCQHSKHHIPFLIRAGYYLDRGYKIRGTGYADSVSEEQFTAYGKDLSLAYNDLITAYERNNSDPIAPMELIGIARGSGLGKEEVQKWYAIGITIDPGFYKLYLQYYYSVLPQWGGQPDEAYNFIQQVNAKAPQGSLVYLLYYDYINRYIDSYDCKLDPDEMSNLNRTLEQIVTRFNGEHPHSTLYASKLLTSKAWCANRNKQNIEAFKYYRESLRTNPYDVETWAGLGGFYASLSNMEDAIVCYDKAVEFSGGDTDVHPNRAIAAKWLKQYDKCIDSYTYAIEHGSGNVIRYYTGRAECYAERGKKNTNRDDFERDIADLDTALELTAQLEGNQTTEIADLLVNRAHAYEHLQLPKKALGDYTRAIMVKGPEQAASAKYYEIRGKYFLRINEIEKAIEDANTIKSFPEKQNMGDSLLTKAYLQDAENRIASGQFDKAVALAQQVLAIFPNDTKAKAIMQKYK